MKYQTDINRDSVKLRQGEQRFSVCDRLGREIGARWEIWTRVYVAVDETKRCYAYTTDEIVPALAAGPGTYYSASTQNTRAGKAYQASTSKLFATIAEAQAYCDAFVARKSKEAPNRAGK